MAARDGADGGTGSARRRRERRLRSWLRHEQQSIAAVLALVTHHSFRKVGTASGVYGTRRQSPGPGTEEEFETHFTAKIRKTPPPAGGQPAPLSEVAGRQVCLERHVMEDLGTVCPFVQILDLPEPQRVENVTDTLRILDLPMAEQVVEVPKISLSPRPSRSCIPEPQVAEQLVEVPTVLSLLRIAEQIVGTPVPLGRGQRRVQGFPKRQSSTLLYSREECISERILEQTVFPFREERISERIVEQIVDFPVSGGDIPTRGGPHGFLPSQGSAASAAAHVDFLAGGGPHGSRPGQGSTACS